MFHATSIIRGLRVPCQQHQWFVTNHVDAHPLQITKSKELSSQVNGCVCDTIDILWTTILLTLSCDFMTTREASVEKNSFSLFSWQWQLCTLLHSPLRSTTQYRSHAQTQVQSPSSTLSSPTSLSFWVPVKCVDNLCWTLFGDSY
jgi:hypothetical protein